MLADRGYDSQANFDHLWNQGIAPVIKIRDMTRGKLIAGVYDHLGVPHCSNDIPMRYVETHPVRGYRYACASQTDPTNSDCHCGKEWWANPQDNIKLFGSPRRASDEWKAIYKKRMGIERIFKAMKQNYRMERHTVRGMYPMTLHVKMSMLIYLAICLLNLQKGEDPPTTTMVPRIA